jgi:archaetidylinositol phosphate synthase
MRPKSRHNGAFVSKLASYPLEPIRGNIGDRQARSFQAPQRIATNFLARPERHLLNQFCRLLPAWVTPDHLTTIGIGGAIITALGYLASNYHPAFFFLASFGLIVNWFGDSLDGSLARYRKIERPRYGFFVDHSVDVINEFIIIAGLGLSPYISMSVALFALCGYYALSLYVYLLHQISGEHRLSFASLGPTEVRLIIIWINSAMFLIGPAQVSFMGRSFPLHTVSIGAVGAALVAIFVANVYKTARELARQGEDEQDRRLRVENVSILSKREAY